jgi:DNA-binding NarL/FixJ family response regulator
MTRTLIVDDSDTFRQTLRNLLHPRFPLMTFEEARDGEEVFQKLEAYHPDLIFMDVRLLGQSGLEITKKIRSSYCQATIIVLTSFDLPEYREAASMGGQITLYQKAHPRPKRFWHLWIRYYPSRYRQDKRDKRKKPEELL